jgi:hypothetical protein
MCLSGAVLGGETHRILQVEISMQALCHLWCMPIAIGLPWRHRSAWPLLIFTLRI